MWTTIEGWFGKRRKQYRRDHFRSDVNQGMTDAMLSTIEAASAVAPPNALSLREKSCLQMVAEGSGLLEVGDRLALSEIDVAWLLSAVEAKLGASNRLHAVSIALRKGEISF